MGPVWDRWDRWDRWGPVWTDETGGTGVDPVETDETGGGPVVPVGTAGTGGHPWDRWAPVEPVGPVRAPVGGSCAGRVAVRR